MIVQPPDRHSGLPWLLLAASGLLCAMLADLLKR